MSIGEEEEQDAEDRESYRVFRCCSMVELCVVVAVAGSTCNLHERATEDKNCANETFLLSRLEDPY